MLESIPYADTIKDDSKIPAPVIAALAPIVERLIRDLLSSLKDGCKYAVVIENFTSQPLNILRQSENENNGHFESPPDNIIEKTTIGGFSSEGGFPEGNKNFVIYRLERADLLIYWHSARVGGKTYFAEIAGNGTWDKMNDKEILNICKDNQTKGVIKGSCGEYNISCTYGDEAIEVAVLTHNQT